MEKATTQNATSQPIVFPSSKSAFMFCVVWGTVALLVGACISTFLTMPDMLVMMVVGIPSLLLLLWIWFDTKYRIENGKLHYSCGPFKGNFPISSIRGIDNKKILMTGLRLGLDFNGMMIQYGKWDEIYISPVDKERFIQALLDINPEIAIDVPQVETPKINFNKY